jgi:hypothetical protein
MLRMRARSGTASEPCVETLLSTLLDRQGERIHGALDLRGDEGVLIGSVRRSRPDDLPCQGVDVAPFQQDNRGLLRGTSGMHRVQRRACVCRRLVGLAVVLREQVDQRLAGTIRKTG